MNRLFKDLFGRKTTQPERISAAEPVKTAPLTDEQLESVTRLQMKLSPPQIAVGTAQSPGRQRDHNEDTLFALSAILADGNADIPFGVFIVADGMGGHQNGEAASGSAVRAIGEFLLSRFLMPLLSGDHGSGESIHEIIESGVREAQRSVLRNAPGGGTTLTVALLLGEQVTIAHVGDSRAYFVYPDGRLVAVTQDHSLVRRLQDLGQIDEKEAALHPQRNVLYRALGQSEPFRPDLNTLTIPRPGGMLLCSDGLWGTVPEEEINRIIQSAESPSMACHRLVEAANAAGGPDNISAVFVQLLG